jgi:hypothetical protein
VPKPRGDDSRLRSATLDPVSNCRAVPTDQSPRERHAEYQRGPACRLWNGRGSDGRRHGRPYRRRHGRCGSHRRQDDGAGAKWVKRRIGKNGGECIRPSRPHYGDGRRDNRCVRRDRRLRDCILVVGQADHIIYERRPLVAERARISNAAQDDMLRERCGAAMRRTARSLTRAGGSVSAAMYRLLAGDLLSSDVVRMWFRRMRRSPAWRAAWGRR